MLDLKNKENINVNEIDEIIDNINIIDIREEDEIRLSGSLSNAVHIPMSRLLMTPEEYLEDDKIYYLLCHSGVRSASACEILRNEGFNVVNLSGGFARYKGENRVDLY